jgi:MFS transporter, DHA1 family, inner membrane transport protein
LPAALLALAVSAFGIGTTEFIMMGLLPEIAASFHVSIPTAGDLISGYALGVVVGAPLLVAASTRLSRRTVLLGLMALFTVGNLFAALAQNYTMMLGARVLTGLPHGAFFGVGSVVAAGMVPSNKRATAISVMFAGLAVANVIGVPAGTLVSQHVGWRVAFALIAAIGVVSMAAIGLMLPRESQSTGSVLASELATFRRPQVWLALAVGTFGFAGVFAVYSYIEPMMTHVAGYSATSVNWLLALFGIGMTVGNLVGGRLADRSLMPSMYGALAALGLLLALFVATAHSQVMAAVTLFLIGAAGMACVPIIQTRIMDVAHGAPSLAAAANHSAFNLANAGGAFLGGLVIAANFGWTAPSWVGAGLAGVGLALAVFSGALDRRPTQSALTATNAAFAPRAWSGKCCASRCRARTSRSVSGA